MDYDIFLSSLTLINVLQRTQSCFSVIATYAKSDKYGIFVFSLSFILLYRSPQKNWNERTSLDHMHKVTFYMTYAMYCFGYEHAKTQLDLNRTEL